MSKIKRNEPCPCGSGKKYKNCHGASNIEITNHEKVDKELNEFYRSFVNFAMDKFRQLINGHVKAISEKYADDNQDVKNILSAWLPVWIMFHVRIDKERNTIFNIFHKANQFKLSAQAAKILNEYHFHASVYEVTHNDSKMTTLTDLANKETYKKPIIEENELEEGNMFIGLLVPFSGHHDFLSNMIQLFRHNKKDLTNLIENYKTKPGGLNYHFPGFLVEALLLGDHSYEWDNEQEEKVYQLFQDKMLAKNVDEETIQKGISIWNEFCRKENPSIIKVESYAAGLEYFIHKELIQNNEVTQSQLASDYGVSSGTVSSNYRKISEAINN